MDHENKWHKVDDEAVTALSFKWTKVVEMICSEGTPEMLFYTVGAEKSKLPTDKEIVTLCEKVLKRKLGCATYEDELQKKLKELLKSKEFKSFATETFQTVDVDNSGSIDSNELVYALISLSDYMETQGV